MAIYLLNGGGAVAAGVVIQLLCIGASILFGALSFIVFLFIVVKRISTKGGQKDEGDDQPND